MAKAKYFGKNHILNSFSENSETPFFAIWDNAKEKQIQNNIDDFDTATEKLEKFLDNNENLTDTLSLVVYPEAKRSYEYQKDYKSATNVFHFIINENKPIQTVGNDSNNILLLEKLNRLESKINALEGEEVEEENEQVGTAEAELLDKISGIVNSPLGVLATTYLPRLLERILPEKQNQLVGLAGNTPTDLETTIEILFSKGVKLEHLQKLAQMEESKIKMLLQML